MAEEVIDLLTDDEDSVLVLENAIAPVHNPHHMDVERNDEEEDEDILDVYDAPPEFLVPGPPPGEDNVGPPNGQLLFGNGNHTEYTNDFVFSYMGRPVPCRRPQFITRFLNGVLRRNVVSQNKQETLHFRNNVRVCLGIRYGLEPEDFPIFGDAPTCIELQFHMPLPNYFFVGSNRSNPLKLGMLELQNTPVVKRPDLDNLVKFVVDALQGIFYKDDKSVVKITASKCLHLEDPYNGCTFLKIRQAGPRDMPY